jgi:enoyl-CoA hydratase
MSKVELECENGRWTLTLNDPERRNSIDAAMRQDLVAALAVVAADRQARALVIAGAGTSFCAGADLGAVFGNADRPVHEIRRDLHAVYECFLPIRSLPIPTIAAVQGPAVGAGLNLAMCCDLRVAGPKAEFAATFTRIGLHPGGGCTFLLVQALGEQRALAMLLDGATVRGAEAVSAGLALMLDDEPLEVATTMADRYARLEPELVRDVKLAVRTAVRGDFDSTLQLESWAQASSAKGPRVEAFVSKFRKH